MIPISPHLVNSSLLALPVAIIFTRKLLLNRNDAVTAGAGALEVRMKHMERRANTLTETLKNIVGYHHHGLND